MIHPHQAVRDLHWALTSPALMAGTTMRLDDAWFARQWTALRAWWEGIAHNPQPLLDFLENRAPVKLGHYFEALLEFWLTSGSSHRLLAKGTQVFRAGRTLGEMDFVGVDAHGHPFHWEVAVKFYLNIVGSRQWQHWVGTEKWDTLERKLHKLQRHQALLSRQPETAHLWPEWGIAPPRSAIWLKGYFFQRLGQKAIRPYASNPAHGAGWWGTLEDVEHTMAGKQHWCLPERLEWLSPVMRRDDGEVLDKPSWKSAVEYAWKQRLAPVLSVVMARQPQGHWQEESRGFVVPPEWPVL
ncbi:MAG: DUF1853 family protein [Bacteroidota bacterium]